MTKTIVKEIDSWDNFKKIVSGVSSSLKNNPLAKATIILTKKVVIEVALRDGFILSEKTDVEITPQRIKEMLYRSGVDPLPLSVTSKRNCSLTYVISLN